MRPKNSKRRWKRSPPGRGAAGVRSQDVSNPKQSQIEKLKEAAREHEADEDEARWDERLRKLAKLKAQPANKNAADGT